MGRACSPVRVGTVAAVQPAQSILSGFGPAFATSGPPTRQPSYEPPRSMQVQSGVFDYGLPIGGSLSAAVCASTSLRHNGSANAQVSSTKTPVVHRHTGPYANIPAAIPTNSFPQHGSFSAVAGGAMCSGSPHVNPSKRVEVEALVPVSANGALAQPQVELQCVKKESSEKDLRIVELQQELSAAKETMAQMQRELDSVRAEAIQALSALSHERKARQVEAAAAELAAEADQAVAEADQAAADAKSLAGPQCANASVERQSRRASAKDDIDMRLHEFLDQNDCILSFRRMNTGWYAFQHPSDPATSGSSQRVELSIVNGKLMAKIEADTHHDRAWNNGKRAGIERFVAAFS